MPALCDPDPLVNLQFTRAQLLAWLAEGGREVRWAVCNLPATRWFAQPPATLRRSVGAWAPAHHVRHLALSARHQTLPLVQAALGEQPGLPAFTTPELAAADAADWAPATGETALEGWLRAIGETRFDLLQRAEAAPDHFWAPLSFGQTPPLGSLTWLLAHLYHHQLRHLGVIWQLALFWDQPPTTLAAPDASGTEPALVHSPILSPIDLRLHPANATRSESLHD